MNVKSKTKQNVGGRKGNQLDMFAGYAPSSPHVGVTVFGGGQLKSHPKRKRPIFVGKAHHIVLKTRKLEPNENMRRKAVRVSQIVEKAARKWKVKLHRFENVGNHLHILMTPRAAESYHGFIRTISGAIALLCAKREVAKNSSVSSYSKSLTERKANEMMKFWIARPFTRLVMFGRDFLQVQYYLSKNRLQAVGFDVFMQELQSGIRSTS